MNTLVTFFSAEGTTAAVAKVIAEALGADLSEIKPAVPYTAADLNWMNKTSRSSLEMADEHCRPAMAETVGISEYDTVFLGFPIWWYVEPRIVDTFLESADFAGKTVVVFATSGGSGAERALARIKSLCPAATCKGGKILTKASAAAWAKQFA